MKTLALLCVVLAAEPPPEITKPPSAAWYVLPSGLAAAAGVSALGMFFSMLAPPGDPKADQLELGLAFGTVLLGVAAAVGFWIIAHDRLHASD